FLHDQTAQIHKSAGRPRPYRGVGGTNMGEAEKSAPPPQAVLGQMINGYWLSFSIIAAARLELADALGDGPSPIGRIAERVGADPDSLYRLMRALASVGIFREEDGRAFAHTP